MSSMISVSLLTLSLLMGWAVLTPAAAAPPPPGQCVTRTQPVTGPVGIKVICKVKICDQLGVVSKTCELPGSRPALPGPSVHLPGGGARLLPGVSGTTAPK